MTRSAVLILALFGAASAVGIDNMRYRICNGLCPGNVGSATAVATPGAAAMSPQEFIKCTDWSTMADVQAMLAPDEEMTYGDPAVINLSDFDRACETAPRNPLEPMFIACFADAATLDREAAEESDVIRERVSINCTRFVQTPDRALNEAEGAAREAQSKLQQAAANTPMFKSVGATMRLRARSGVLMAGDGPNSQTASSSSATTAAPSGTSSTTTTAPANGASSSTSTPTTTTSSSSSSASTSGGCPPTATSCPVQMMTSP